MYDIFNSSLLSFYIMYTLIVNKTQIPEILQRKDIFPLGKCTCITKLPARVRK